VRIFIPVIKYLYQPFCIWSAPAAKHQSRRWRRPIAVRQKKVHGRRLEILQGSICVDWIALQVNSTEKATEEMTIVLCAQSPQTRDHCCMTAVPIEPSPMPIMIGRISVQAYSHLDTQLIKQSESRLSKVNSIRLQ
jgi:hypothetical protein